MTRYRERTVLQGVPGTPGVATGSVCLAGRGTHRVMPVRRIAADEVPRELERLQRTVESVAADLVNLEQAVGERLGAQEAAIFSAQRLILYDSGLATELRQRLEQGFGAETAVQDVLGEYEEHLSAAGKGRLSESTGDLGELKRRLLDALSSADPESRCTRSSGCLLGHSRIVVAQHLTPSLVLGAEAQEALGFVTERGGPSSHGGVLARALGKPAVSGLAGIQDSLACGTDVLVDGSAGTVIVWPNVADRDRAARRPAPAPRAPSEPVVGLSVLANISLSSEARQARELGAEGVGLYRTEYEQLVAGRALSEDEQFARYVAVHEAMQGLPVTYRLLDLSAEKRHPTFAVLHERNPALGMRGARLLLKFPELLRSQARALARLSEYGVVRVLYPMIVDLAQYRRLRQLFEDSIGDLPSARLLHGVMFEVPSACLQAREILAEADFASIGSNDLLQFLLAADRDNEELAGELSSDHEAFWTLVALLVEAARATERPLIMCGEVAGSPANIPKLLAAGLEAVSVGLSRIAPVRDAVRSWLSPESQGHPALESA